MRPRFAPLATLVALSLAACAVPDGTPTVVAHRMGTGHWPENSRTALAGAIDAGYAALEFDVVLSSNGVPFLAHDPWPSEEKCTHADGTAVEGRPLFKDMTADQIRQDFRCGGIAVEDFPDAETLAEPLLELSEIHAMAQGHPEVHLFYDLKYEPGLTADAKTYVSALFASINAANLPNPRTFANPFPEVLEEVEAQGSADGETTVLSWPFFPHDASSTAVGLKKELAAVFGFENVLTPVRRSGLDGISLPYQLADPTIVQEARSEGRPVYIWTANDEGLLGALCGWPITGVITDFPERAPCYE